METVVPWKSLLKQKDRIQFSMSVRIITIQKIYDLTKTCKNSGNQVNVPDSGTGGG